MCSLKSDGGLTKGRDMSEEQLVTGIQSSPSSTHISKVMQSLTGVDIRNFEQQKCYQISTGSYVCLL